ncbi:MAG: dihydrodipicolinate reductase, partial [Pseudomonadota bacterium]
MKLGVVGAAGRMGRALIRAVHEHDGVSLGAATERSGLGMKGA